MFDIDIEWVEDNLMTRDPELYNRLFQRNVEEQSGKELPTFPIPIRNSKETGETEFHFYDPTLKFQHNNSNSCFFVSLSSALQ